MSDLLPVRGSIHVRPLFEFIDDTRVCKQYAPPREEDGCDDIDERDHSICLSLSSAASWPDPTPFCDLNDVDDDW